MATDTDALKLRLVEIRKGLGFTQNAMANQLGMSLRAYNDIETGISKARTIHVLAAERVALINAVLKEAPELAPLEVRQDAIDLARMAGGVR